MRRETLIRGGFVAVLVLGLAFHISPWAERLDGKLLDGQFQVLSTLGDKRAASDVILVGIDEDTFEQFPEPMALWHEYLGKFFLAMAQAQPESLALDIVLPERSYDFLVPGYDRALLTGLVALRDSVPVFLGQTVDDHGSLRRLYPPLVSVAGPDAVGLVLVQPDSDGTIRRYHRQHRFGETARLTLAGAMAARLGLDMPENGIIDFAVGPPIPYVALQDVLARYEAGEVGELEAAFSGRHVFLGAVLPFEDRHAVPVALAEWEPHRRIVPGALVHAQTLRSLDAGGLIRLAPAWTALAGVVLAAMAWWLGQRPVLGIVVTGAVLFGVLLASGWWLWNGLSLALAGTVVTGVAGLGGRMALEGALSFREKRRLRHSFGRYVSPHVLSEILDGGLRPELGGERQRVCVLFSDIRGFTTRSESQPPESSITLLNRYFEIMTRAIHDYDGTIGTFMGDGIFAFYGAPRPSRNPSRQAFLSAQRMLRDLSSFNQRLIEENIEPIQMGIGLHTGDAVIGHVGSRNRIEYTAIGDTVNTAARLEGLTKTIGYAVALSETTARELNDEWPLADCGLQAVKGRADVRVFGWRSGDGNTA